MLMHTWKDPEILQIWTVNQANHDDWPKECPVSPEEILHKSSSNYLEGET